MWRFGNDNQLTGPLPYCSRMNCSSPVRDADWSIFQLEDSSYNDQHENLKVLRGRRGVREQYLRDAKLGLTTVLPQ
jgi:hypothetical protein